MTLMSARSRPAHRARILGVLIEAGTASRAELARRTGLSPSTVSTVVADLRAEGLVIDAPASLAAPPRPAPGRPAAPLCLHRSAGIVVGIDLGKRHLRVAASDLSHQLLSERRETLDADMPAADAIPLTVGLVDRVLEEAGVGQDTVVGVGMGLAGPVHEPSGKLGDSTILPAGSVCAPPKRCATRSGCASRWRTMPTSAPSASTCGEPAAASTTSSIS